MPIDKKLDGVYQPAFSFVNVPMLAIVFSILILIWYFVLRPNAVIGSFMGGKVHMGGAPGTPAQDYLSYAGWYQAQYNSDGAEAGYKTSGIDVYRRN